MNEHGQVLVIDDDEDIRETVGLILEFDGYSVAAAGDGRAALLWIETHGPPTMILLDMMMPGMNGEEFVRELRARHDGASEIPVVILTGDARAESKAKELGVNACLQKPVELHQLEETVHRFTRH